MSLALRHTLILTDQLPEILEISGRFVFSNDVQVPPGEVIQCRFVLQEIVQEIPHTITTDFAGYAFGSGTPGDWTEEWLTTAATYDIVNARTLTTEWLQPYPTGPGALHVIPSAISRVALSSNRVGLAKNFDVRGHFFAPSGTANGHYNFYFHVRGQGTTSSETAYRLVVPIGATTSYYARITKYVSGASTDITTIQYDIHDGYGYYFRFQCVDSTLKAKIWRDNLLEPRPWLLTGTDSDITTAGWFGFGQSDTDDYYIDWVSVGLNGAEPDIPDNLHTGSNRLGINVPVAGDNFAYNNQAVTSCFYLDTPVDRRVDKVAIYVTTHSSNVRVALYKGGLPEDPSGATLVEDLGVTTGTGTNQWVYVTSSTNPLVSDGDLLWIVTKNNDTGTFASYWENNDPLKGNHPTLAYYISSAFTLDETSAYPGTWPSDSGSWTSTHVPEQLLVFFPLVKEMSPTISAVSVTSSPVHTGITGNLFATSLSVSITTSSILLDNKVSGTTDFSEYTSAIPPSDWTEYWDTANFATTVIDHGSSEVVGEIGTKCLYWEGSASSRRFLAWDDSQTFYNGGLLAKLKLRSDSADDANWGRVHLRSGGTASNESGVVLTIDDGSFLITAYKDGTGYAVANEAMNAFTSDEEFWVRFEVDGLNARAKLWNYDHPEPEDWTLSDTMLESEDPGPGLAGVGSFGNADYDLDYFAFYSADSDIAEFPKTSYYEDTYFGTTGEVFTSSAAWNYAMAMGGYLPDTRNLTGIRFYKAGIETGSVRFAVYAGGTASDPEGATLVQDFGETAVVATDGYWVTDTCSATPIIGGQFVWVCYKSNDNTFKLRFTADVPQHGNYQTARGRLNIGDSGISPDETVAYPSVISSGSSAGTSWYQVEAIFEARADVELTSSIAAATTESHPNLAGDVFFDLAIVASSDVRELAIGDPLTITNPGGETGDATGWTTDYGTGTVPSVRTIPAEGGAGTYIFAVSTNDVVAGYRQDIEIPSGWFDLVDENSASAVLSAALWGYTGASGIDDDASRLILEAYSSTTTVNETTYLGRWQNIGTHDEYEDVYGQFYRVKGSLPSGTRLLRIQVEGLRTHGTELSAYQDEFKLQLQKDRQRHEVTITNPAINVSNTTGWTTDNFDVRSSTDNIVSIPCGPFFFSGIAVASGYLHQTVDVPAYLFDYIDNHGQGGATKYYEVAPGRNERIVFHFGAMLGSWSTSDKLKVTITFLKEDLTSLGTLSSSDKAFSEYWEFLDLSVVPPQNTRKIKIRFDGTRVFGTNNDGYVAGMEAYFTTSNFSLSSTIAATSVAADMALTNTYRNYGWEFMSAVTSAASSATTRPGNALSSNIVGGIYYFRSAYSAVPFTIDIELTASQIIEAYRLECLTINDDIPDTFTLYGSTTGAFGGEEVTLDSQSSLSWSNGESKLFPFTNSTTYKYYRLSFTPEATHYWDIKSIQLLSSNHKQGDRRFGLNTDVAFGETATGSIEYSIYLASSAIDRDYDTYWWNGYNTSPQWWQVQLSEAKTVRRVAILAAHGFGNYAPIDFDVLGSNTGVFGGEETTLGSYLVDYWGSGGLRHFDLTTTGSFLYYRIDIADTESYMGMGEVYLLEGVAVALELASSFEGASSTSPINLDRNLEFSSAISAASETTTISMEIVVLFNSAISTSTSVGDIAASITRSITSNILAASSTTDVQTGVLRDLTAGISAQSSSTNIFLNPGRLLASASAGASSTSDIQVGVLRELALEIGAASSSDAVFLDLGVTFSCLASASSQTSEITILVVAALTSTIAAGSSLNAITLFTEKAVDDATLTWPLIHAESQTSAILLEVPGDIIFATSIAASSQTSSVPLATQLELTTSIAAASSTSSFELGILRALTAAATAASQSSSVTLAVEREVTSSAAAASLVADAGLAIARDVSALIEAASVTSQVPLSNAMEFATSITSSTDVSTVDFDVLRDLSTSIYAESSVSQPIVTAFTEDPTQDDIIATARNYRVVIPAAAMSGVGNEVRVLFRAHSAQNTVVTGASFGQRSGSTVDYVTGDPVRLTFDTGDNGYVIPGGTEYWSDWIEFDLDSGVDHLVHVFINATPHYFKTKDQAGPTYVRAGAFNDTMVTDAPDAEYSLDAKHYHVVSIEARTTANVGVLREITSSAAAVSEASEIRLGEYVVFAPAIAATSSTEDITLGLELPMSGAISATTVTSDIDIYFPLSSSMAATSETAAISLLLAVDIDFDSAMSASSVTSDVNLDRNYEFASAISAGSSTTDVPLWMEYQLSTAISAATTMASSGLAVERSLYLAIAAASEVGDIDLWVSSILDLASLISGASATSASNLGVIRPLSCAINSESLSQNINLLVERVLSTVVSNTTETTDVAIDIEVGLSTSILAVSDLSIIELLLYTPLELVISAVSYTEQIAFMTGLFPLIIDLRIFPETVDRDWDSATPNRIYVSATAVRTYESETPVLEIENRTGMEVYSIPYEAKPYPFT